MDIIKKLQEVGEKHQKINSELEQLQQRANVIVDELKRLQGEYRLLVEIGQAEGLVDKDGSPVQEVSEEKIKEEVRKAEVIES